MSDCFEVAVQRLAPESSPVPADILAEIKALFHQRYPMISPADEDYADRVKDVVVVYGAGIGRRIPPLSRGWAGRWPAAMDSLLDKIHRWLSLANPWLLNDAGIAGAYQIKEAIGAGPQREIALAILMDLLTGGVSLVHTAGRSTATNRANQLKRCEQQHSLFGWLAEVNRLPLSMFLARAVKGPLRQAASKRSEEGGLGWLFAPGAFLQGSYGMYLAQNHGLKLVNVLVWRCPEHRRFKNLAQPGAVCVQCLKEKREQPTRYDPVRHELGTTQWLMFLAPDGSPPQGWNRWQGWRCQTQSCGLFYPKADATCPRQHPRTAGAGLTTAFEANWLGRRKPTTQVKPFWLSPARKEAESEVANLSDEQQEILEFLLTHVSVKEAAAALGITEAECKERYRKMKRWLNDLMGNQ